MQKLLKRPAIGAMVAVAVALLLWLLIDGGTKKFFTYLILGLITGAVYAIAASGLVVTYTTSGIFNFAHGAIGMVMAFMYWQLNVDWGLPSWLSFILIVFVIAPLFGAIVERVLMRNLAGATVVTTVVITIGLLVMLIGVAQSAWPPNEAHLVEEFFAGKSVEIADIAISGHQLFSVAAALIAAAALYVILNRTRVGLAMRAVVDDRNLVSLNGARPNQISMLAWALGASLAGLAGVLLAPIVQLEIFTLTLLVINAYAAAMVGRLQSLPRTFLGALALGLLIEFYRGYVSDPDSETLSQLNQGLSGSLPVVFLFLALLFLPQARLRVGRLVGAKAPRVPGLLESAAGTVALVIVTFVVSGFLSEADQARAGKGLAYALVMLSLVPLTGYAAQLSLAQLTFAGLGGFAMGKFGADWGFGPGLLLAAAMAGVAGMLFALPALRLQGLYLALTTMAFAVMLDKMFFNKTYGYGFGGSIRVPRPDFFDGERAFMVLMAIAFGLLGMMVLALKRGPFGRRLSAMRDSPAACATLGLDLTRTKLQVFALAGAMAGVAGVFFGAQQGSLGATDVLMEQGLPVLLLAVIGGVTSVTGALLGGLLFGLRPLLEDSAPSLAGITYLVIGAVTVSLGRNPNGLSFFLSERFGARMPWRRFFDRRESTQRPAPTVDLTERELVGSAT
jgi:branched-chain amino acid transport system permease protein